MGGYRDDAALDTSAIKATLVHGPDRVYDCGTVTFTFTPEGESQSQQMTSTYFALFERTSRGWKIIREMLSLNHPPAGADQ